MARKGITSDSKIMAVDVKQKGDSLEIGNAQMLFQTHPASYVRAISSAYVYDVSADGKKFLFELEVFQGTSDPLALVVNWAAELRK